MSSELHEGQPGAGDAQGLEEESARRPPRKEKATSRGQRKPGPLEAAEQGAPWPLGKSGVSGFTPVGAQEGWEDAEGPVSRPAHPSRSPQALQAP